GTFTGTVRGLSAPISEVGVWELPSHRCDITFKLLWSTTSLWAGFALLTTLLYRIVLYRHANRLAMVDRKMEENIAQFCGVTGASVKDAKKFLEAYKRSDVAIDAYFNDPRDPRVFGSGVKTPVVAASTSKLNSLFDKYKDPDGVEITVNGTIQLCADLGVDPEDVVLLAVAYELKSPRVGEWNRAGWTEGWKNLGQVWRLLFCFTSMLNILLLFYLSVRCRRYPIACDHTNRCDSLSAMKASLPKLKAKLAQDAAYFQKVYNHTFDFAKSEGQRSIAIDTAQAFWSLLLPHGMSGAALSHVDSSGDSDMTGDGGWQPQFVDWWFEFLNEKGGKGVSKDTWVMFLDFVRTIDSRFQTYDIEAAWPSAIDDFVDWAKTKLKQ
ncbi:unnamed protein product, partial [Mycena citricolor]